MFNKIFFGLKNNYNAKYKAAKVYNILILKAETLVIISAFYSS